MTQLQELTSLVDVNAPLLSGVLVCLLSTSCSSGTQSDAKPVCGPSSPCGGDLIGLWNSKTSCLAATGTIALGLCHAAFTSNPEIVMTDVTFREDGVFSQNTSLRGQAEVQVPAQCLQVQGVTITCDQAQAALQQQVPTTCVNRAEGGCTCTTMLATGSSASSNSGTYSTQDGVLTLQRGAEIEQSDYCVQGGQLLLVPHKDSSMFKNVGVVDAQITGSIVLMR